MPFHPPVLPARGDDRVVQHADALHVDLHHVARPRVPLHTTIAVCGAHTARGAGGGAHAANLVPNPSTAHTGAVSCPPVNRSSKRARSSRCSRRRETGTTGAPSSPCTMSTSRWTP